MKLNYPKVHLDHDKVFDFIETINNNYSELVLVGHNPAFTEISNYFSENILPSIFKGPWNGIVELGYTTALIGASAALIRRVIFTPEKLKGKSQLEGNFILV